MRLLIALLLLATATPAIAGTVDLDKSTAGQSAMPCGSLGFFTASAFWGSNTANGIVGAEGVGNHASTYVIRDNQPVTQINGSFTQFSSCKLDGTSAAVSVNVAHRVAGFVGNAGCFRVQGFRPDGEFDTYGTLCGYITANTDAVANMEWRMSCGDQSCGGVSFSSRGLRLQKVSAKQTQEIQAAVRKSKSIQYLCITDDGTVFRSATACN